jgi:mercuric ion transport protein
MGYRKLLGVGIGGTVITAICCFTPVLAVLLGAVGLSIWLGWLDYVLLPALAAFVGITLYALYQRRKHLTEARNAEGSQ